MISFLRSLASSALSFLAAATAAAPRTLPIAALLLSLVASLAASPAPAGVISDAGPLFTPIRRSSLPLFAKTLNLDKDQLATVVLLHNGYKEALRHAAASLDKAEEVARESHEKKKSGQPMPDTDYEQVTAFVTQADKLTQGFFDDIKEVIRPEQAAKIEDVQRQQRRISGLRFAIAAGEDLDMMRLATDLKLDTTPEIAQLLQQYESDFDALMKSKRTTFQALFDALHKLQQDGHSPDPEAMLPAITKMVAHSMKVRDANRAVAKSIASLLTDAHRETWENEIRLRSYSRVFKQSFVAANVAKSLELPDLSDDQRNRITSLQETYTRELLPINIKWTVAIEDKLTQFLEKGIAFIMELEMLEHSEAQQRDKDSLYAARKARFDLDAATFARLTSILSPAQFELLPNRKPKDPIHERGVSQDVIAMDESTANNAGEDFFNDSDSDESAPSDK